MFSRVLGAVVSLAVAGMMTAAQAVTVVAPGYADRPPNSGLGEGNQNSTEPFTWKQTGGDLVYVETYRYQQIYGADLFGDNSGIIDTIAFRADRDSPLKWYSAASLFGFTSGIVVMYATAFVVCG
jgi:hypothetical protein